MVLPIEGEMPKGRGGLYFMKKEYIKPETEMMLIEAQQMLAASNFPGIGSGNATGNGALSTSMRDEWDDLWD